MRLHTGASVKTHKDLESLLEEASKVILGKETEIRLAVACLLARGHLLVEDVPGVGKTTLIKLLSRLFDLPFRRIQFTNDLLPADITGSSVFDSKSGQFTFHPGPLFTQLVLADELNRATPKTQSALLQAMEEAQITVDRETHSLPKPFFVVATQNPTEQYGTFPLPESQLDRFLMRIHLGFPNRDAERTLLKGADRNEALADLQRGWSVGDLIQVQDEVNQVFVSDPVADYVLDILARSRSKAGQGFSPRAGLNLLRAAKAWAWMSGRKMVIPEDVQAVAPAVMNHRMWWLQGQLSERSHFELARDLVLSVPVR